MSSIVDFIVLDAIRTYIFTILWIIFPHRFSFIVVGPFPGALLRIKIKFGSRYIKRHERNERELTKEKSLSLEKVKFKFQVCTNSPQAYLFHRKLDD